MTDRQKKAKAAFHGGYNCAQSVLLAFRKDLGLRDDTFLKLASGFGSGMGRMQETCGVITGGTMVISYLYGRYGAVDPALKEKSIKMISDFMKAFLKKHNHADCFRLLGLDLSTPEGRQIQKKDRSYKNKCTIYVMDAVEILECEILALGAKG